MLSVYAFGVSFWLIYRNHLSCFLRFRAWCVPASSMRWHIVYVYSFGDAVWYCEFWGEFLCLSMPALKGKNVCGVY